jgi:Calcineurin-like phosphoesterase
MRQRHSTHLILLLLLVFAAWAGCTKATKAPPPAGDATATPAGDATADPVRDAAVLPPKGLERTLDFPARLVKNPEKIRFLVLGDTRAPRCRCSLPRKHRKHRKHCRVWYTPNAHSAAEDCAIVDQAPALLLGGVANRLRTTTAKAPAATADRPHFSLFTGDLVYRGSCTRDWDWARRVFLNKLPPGRVFPIIGNHDSWQRRNEPSAIAQYFSAFPHLKLNEKGQSVLPHFYAFRIGRSLFVNLCTGGYPASGTAADFARADRQWLCEQASFKTQMRWMDRVLAQSASKGVRHVFVQYHKPSFSCSRHPPLAPKYDPLTRLRAFKKRHRSVNVVALSGHNHTTAVYLSGGVLVLVAGGGGAPQHFQHGARACHKDKPNQPPELFWKGTRRTLRYNYFQINVTGEDLSIQEHCLARVKGQITFQKGSRISPTGQITHTPDTCNLSP